jgi:hypothetical protein
MKRLVAALLGGIVVATALCFWRTPILDLWNSLRAEVRTALISGVATVTAASIAATMVVWQIGKQAQNAIRQSSHSERIKLKLQLYNEISEVVRLAGRRELDFSSYISKFAIEAMYYQAAVDAGLKGRVPSARAPVMMEVKNNFRIQAAELLHVIEEWEIIDPRLNIFKTAFNVAVHDVEQSFQSYLSAVMHVYPVEFPDGHPNKGELAPWQPPSPGRLQDIKALGEHVWDKLLTFGSYLFDFRVEIQNLLMQDLFDNRATPRVPIDPKYVVVTLENAAELERVFAQSPWGLEKARHDKANLEKLQTSGMRADATR